MDQPISATRSSRFVSLVGRRWTIDVLVLLVESGCRYQEIHDGLDGVSYKVLTETLRREERDGLVSGHLDPDRVETATLCRGRDTAAPTDRREDALGRTRFADYLSMSYAAPHLFDGRLDNFEFDVR